MLGKELVDFIVRNHLTEVKIQTEWSDCLTWSIFLDEKKLLEVEYNWNYNGHHTICYFDFTNYDANDPDTYPDKKDISEEEALELRKEHGKI